MAKFCIFFLCLIIRCYGFPYLLSGCVHPSTARGNHKAPSSSPTTSIDFELRSSGALVTCYQPNKVHSLKVSYPNGARALLTTSAGQFADASTSCSGSKRKDYTFTATYNAQWTSPSSGSVTFKITVAESSIAQYKFNTLAISECQESGVGDGIDNLDDSTQLDLSVGGSAQVGDDTSNSQEDQQSQQDNDDPKNDSLAQVNFQKTDIVILVLALVLALV
eukprot:TRINITY_DN12848_c0_g1_i1.p1 TRINITY_DN12848_c0_g1~~TRINITY_DN12848_c0_g1_i1.p1  ORF type:complete len:253 (-),score=6.08 TRINITY_DN12848_c0_g1_i1:280-939(-)